MLQIILIGAAAFIGMKALSKTGNTTKTVGSSATKTPVASATGSGAVGTVLSILGISQGAGSAKGNGNANQPWYTGPAVTGAASSGISLGLKSLTAQSDPTATADEPDVDDEDLSDAQNDMATSSASATSDDEDASGSDDSAEADSESDDA